MSGIVGILHLDDSPVERRTLQGLTNFLAARGPDAQQVWVDGPNWIRSYPSQDSSSKSLTVSTSPSAWTEQPALSPTPVWMRART